MLIDKKTRWQRSIRAYEQRLTDMAMWGNSYSIDGKIIVRDHDGNFIFICPNCKLEYTVPIDKGLLSINYHCEVETCKYAILRFKTTDDIIEQETLSIEQPINANDKGGVC